MRIHSLVLILAAAALCSSSCDQSPKPNPANSQRASAETSAAADEAEVREPIAPDDGAEPVAMDETGWPELLTAGAKSDDEAEEEARYEGVSEEANEPVRALAKWGAPGEKSFRSRPNIYSKASPRSARAKSPFEPEADGVDREPRWEEVEYVPQAKKARKRMRKTAEAFVRAEESRPGRTVVVPEPDPDADSLLMIPDATRGQVDPSLRDPTPKQVEQPETKKLSTFAVDVDTGSYSLSLARMRRGYPPKAESIRVEEWLNTFHYDHHPGDGKSFSIAMEAAPNPFATNSDKHLLRVNVAGKSVADQDRPAAHLTFVIDVSGSMFGPDKLDLVKESLTLLVSKLRPDDTVAIVSYAKVTEVALWPTSGKESDKILAAIAGLEPGGSTALDEGLKLGYGVAFRESHFNPGDIHRVVLLGDGRANVGARDVDSLLRPIQIAVTKGVTLSTIGFGARAFNDKLMEQLANRGNGNYAFIDSYRDARRVFGEQLCGTLHVIGKDAKIQVEFNLDRVRSWQLIGYENRAMADADFRNDEADGGEIGAGHQVTALYELELTEASDGPLATARFRWEDPDSGEVSEMESTLESVTEDLRRASDDFKFAASVAAAADRFKAKSFTSGPNASLIREIAGAAAGSDQPARRDFVEMLEELEPFMKD